jgi:integrase
LANEQKLLSKSADHLQPIIITALNTGMRRNEILTLTWGNVDLNQKIIYIVKTKSGKNREVPVNEELFSLLYDMKTTSKSEYVFTNPDTMQPFKSIRHSFENACRRAGIIRLRFHDLRHTFATRLVRKGVDVETLRSLLGHFSITVTERYIHTAAEQKRQAVNLLNKNTSICDMGVIWPEKGDTKSEISVS